MAITAASIEANGWVLAIKHNNGLGSFASYALTPDATPALTINSVHPGFDLSGGVAVANASKPRSFTGTKPVRKPAVVSNAGVLSAKSVDETDNGDGTVTVRIALSGWVYATDSALSLTALAGWRTGEAAATIAVTNNSTQVCPAPIHRWADVPYKLQRGAYTIELLVFGFFPQGHQPIAAVKLTITDGTTVKTVWTSALATSPQYGDNLRCYTVSVDPSLATALTPGLHRIDAEVYPWIGVMRPTDIAGTKAMANLATSSVQFGAGDGMLGKAQAPFVVAWDPAGVRYPFKCVFVDFVNGTTTASTAMIGGGGSDAAALTAAKAVTPAARAKDAATAAEALRLAGYSYPAANGQAAASNIIDGCRIVLAAGTHTNALGGGTVGYSPWCVETWLRIEGDPTDANPRQNVVLRTSPTVSGDFRSYTQRVMFGSMSIELGYDLLLYCRYQWHDNIEFRGQTGQTTSTRNPTGGASAPATYLGMHFTRSRIWKSGVSFNYQFGGRAKLVRNCEHRRAAESPVCVKNRVISELEDPSFTGIQGTWITGALSSWGDDLSVYDSIVAYCDLRANKEEMWNAGFLPAAATAHPVYTAAQFRRQVLFGNVGERIGNTGSPGVMNFDKMFACGEQTQADMADLIVEANTVAGERVNWGYNDSQPLGANTTAGVAATDAQTQNSYVNSRVAGNMFGGQFSKHDRFDDPAVKAQRVAAGDPRAHGVRPYNTGCYASLYGVGQRDNVNLTETFVGSQIEQVLKEYDGLNCLFTNAALDPKYTSDQSRWRLGVDQVNTATGVGNYAPLAGSPALARVASGNSDRDLNGATRGAASAAGAIEGAAVVVTALAPAAARHPSLVSSPVVQWSAVIAGASARDVSRASVTTMAWSGTVAGTRAAQATRSGIPGLGWVTSLAASRAALTTRAGAANPAWSTVLTAVHATLALPRTTASLDNVSWAAPLTPAHGALAMRAAAGALAALNGPPSSLLPDSALHILRDAFGLVLQAGGNNSGTVRTLSVPSDLRIRSIALS